MEKKYLFQASAIDQTTFPLLPFASWHVHSVCVRLLNGIYYLQTVSILKVPPWGRPTKS